MIASFCEIERPMIDIHIWTFTENPGCFVSKSAPGLSNQALVNYAKSIVLCRPPDFPSVSAGGGDGPENVTAAMASLLLSFESNQNLLVFIITDAPPHHKAFGNGTETLEERKWLKEHDFEETDVFILLCEIIDSLNVTFVPVSYGTAQTNVWMHQAANMTDGLVLCPKSGDSKTLAEGLSLLLDSFQKLSFSRDLQLLDSLNIDKLSQAFSVLDIPQDSYEIIEEDPDTAQSLTKSYPHLQTSQSIIEKVLGLFKTTFDRFSGKKASKRCRGVNVEHISMSIKVFLLTMLKNIGSSLTDEHLIEKSVNEFRTILKDLSEKDQKMNWELKIFERYLEELPAIHEKFLKFDKDNENKFRKIECMVSMERVGSCLKNLDKVPASQEELSEWMDLILQVCLVKLINVKFPLDANKNPDFADAWAASLTNIEFSSFLSASGALLLRSKEDNNYIAPVSMNKNNVALMIAHPNDSELSEIYKSLSYFPTLQGLIQSHLISGSYKIFPSILQGLQASCFWYILRTKGKDPSLQTYEWELIRSLIHSLRSSSYKVVPTIFTSLRDSLPLNPVDNITKLLAGYLIYFNYPQSSNLHTILRLLFEEYSADCISFELKKLNNENFKDYVSSLPTDQSIAESFINSEEIQNFDPCSGLHPVEVVCKEKKGLGPDFLNKVVEKIGDGCSFMNRCVNVFKLFCRILRADLKVEAFEDAMVLLEEPRLDQVLADDELQNIFVESFLLRKRTARYVLDDSSKEWKRNDLGRVDSAQLEKACVEIVENFFRGKFAEWNSIRKESVNKKLIEQVNRLQGETIDDFNSQLEKIEATTADVCIRFSRMLVPDVLESIPVSSENYEKRLSTLGLALVTGNWTKAPPSQLKRFADKISKIFAFSSEIQEQINLELKKQQVCTRPDDKPNRHGHTVSNPFPGIRGWTQEYEDKVVSHKKGDKKVKFLQKIKNFSLFYNKVLSELHLKEDYGDEKKNLIRSCLNFTNNALQTEKTIKFVERLEKINFSGLQDDEEWKRKLKEVEVKLMVSKHAFKYLEGLIAYAEKKE